MRRTPHSAPAQCSPAPRLAPGHSLILTGSPQACELDMFYEQPMVERRHAPRQKSFLHGFVYWGGNPSAVDCLVRDISDSGARLKFSSGQTPAGDIVDLHIPLK